jgi:YbgC/YbaW family acyl-CoA thioester hydrolase
MINKLEITVRSTEVDTLGHVNNAKYQEYLEWGRWEWSAHSEIPEEMLRTRGLAGVVVNVNISYLSEARMNDKLIIETCLSALGNSSITFLQRIVQADGRVACSAEVKEVIFDTKARKSAPIPKDLREMAEKLLVSAPWEIPRKV